MVQLSKGLLIALAVTSASGLVALPQSHQQRTSGKNTTKHSIISPGTKWMASHVPYWNETFGPVYKRELGNAHSSPMSVYDRFENRKSKGMKSIPVSDLKTHVSKKQGSHGSKPSGSTIRSRSWNYMPAWMRAQLLDRSNNDKPVEKDVSLQGPTKRHDNKDPRKSISRNNEPGRDSSETGKPTDKVSIEGAHNLPDATETFAPKAGNSIGLAHDQELHEGDPGYDEGYDDDNTGTGTWTDVFQDVPQYIDDFVDGLPHGAELLSIHDILYGYPGVKVPRRVKKWLKGLPVQYQTISIGYIGGNEDEKIESSSSSKTTVGSSKNSLPSARPSPIMTADQYVHSVMSEIASSLPGEIPQQTTRPVKPNSKFHSLASELDGILDHFTASDWRELSSLQSKILSAAHHNPEFSTILTDRPHPTSVQTTGRSSSLSRSSTIGASSRPEETSRSGEDPSDPDERDGRPGRPDATNRPGNENNHPGQPENPDRPGIPKVIITTGAHIESSTSSKISSIKSSVSTLTSRSSTITNSSSKQTSISSSHSVNSNSPSAAKLPELSSTKVFASSEQKPGSNLPTSEAWKVSSLTISTRPALVTTSVLSKETERPMTTKPTTVMMSRISSLIFGLNTTSSVVKPTSHPGDIEFTVVSSIDDSATSKSSPSTVSSQTREISSSVLFQKPGSSRVHSVPSASVSGEPRITGSGAYISSDLGISKPSSPSAPLPGEPRPEESSTSKASVPNTSVPGEQTISKSGATSIPAPIESSMPKSSPPIISAPGDGNVLKSNMPSLPFASISKSGTSSVLVPSASKSTFSSSLYPISPIIPFRSILDPGVPTESISGISKPSVPSITEPSISNLLKPTPSISSDLSTSISKESLMPRVSTPSEKPNLATPSFRSSTSMSTVSSISSHKISTKSFEATLSLLPSNSLLTGESMTNTRSAHSSSRDTHTVDDMLPVSTSAVSTSVFKSSSKLQLSSIKQDSSPIPSYITHTNISMSSTFSENPPAKTSNLQIVSTMESPKATSFEHETSMKTVEPSIVISNGAGNQDTFKSSAVKETSTTSPYIFKISSIGRVPTLAGSYTPQVTSIPSQEASTSPSIWQKSSVFVTPHSEAFRTSSFSASFHTVVSPLSSSPVTSQKTSNTSQEPKIGSSIASQETPRPTQETSKVFSSPVTSHKMSQASDKSSRVSSPPIISQESLKVSSAPTVSQAISRASSEIPSLSQGFSRFSYVSQESTVSQSEYIQESSTVVETSRAILTKSSLQETPRVSFLQNVSKSRFSGLSSLVMETTKASLVPAASNSEFSIFSSIVSDSSRPSEANTRTSSTLATIQSQPSMTTNFISGTSQISAPNPSATESIPDSSSISTPTQSGLSKLSALLPETSRSSIQAASQSEVLRLSSTISEASWRSEKNFVSSTLTMLKPSSLPYGSESVSLGSKSVSIGNSQLPSSQLPSSAESLLGLFGSSSIINGFSHLKQETSPISASGTPKTSFSGPLISVASETSYSPQETSEAFVPTISTVQTALTPSQSEYLRKSSLLEGSWVASLPSSQSKISKLLPLTFSQAIRTSSRRPQEASDAPLESTSSRSGFSESSSILTSKTLRPSQEQSRTLIPTTSVSDPLRSSLIATKTFYIAESSQRVSGLFSSLEASESSVASQISSFQSESPSQAFKEPTDKAEPTQNTALASHSGARSSIASVKSEIEGSQSADVPIPLSSTSIRSEPTKTLTAENTTISVTVASQSFAFVDPSFATQSSATQTHTFSMKSSQIFDISQFSSNGVIPDSTRSSAATAASQTTSYELFESSVRSTDYSSERVYSTINPSTSSVKWEQTSLSVTQVMTSNKATSTIDVMSSVKSKTDSMPAASQSSELFLMASEPTSVATKGTIVSDSSVSEITLTRPSASIFISLSRGAQSRSQASSIFSIVESHASSREFVSHSQITVSRSQGITSPSLSISQVSSTTSRFSSKEGNMQSTLTTASVSPSESIASTSYLTFFSSPVKSTQLVSNQLESSSRNIERSGQASSMTSTSVQTAIQSSIATTSRSPSTSIDSKIQESSVFSSPTNAQSVSIASPVTSNQGRSSASSLEAITNIMDSPGPNTSQSVKSVTQIEAHSTVLSKGTSSLSFSRLSSAISERTTVLSVSLSVHSSVQTQTSSAIESMYSQSSSSLASINSLVVTASSTVVASPSRRPESSIQIQSSSKLEQSSRNLSSSSSSFMSPSRAATPQGIQSSIQNKVSSTLAPESSQTMYSISSLNSATATPSQSVEPGIQSQGSSSLASETSLILSSMSSSSLISSLSATASVFESIVDSSLRNQQHSASIPETFTLSASSLSSLLQTSLASAISQSSIFQERSQSQPTLINSGYSAVTTGGSTSSSTTIFSAVSSKPSEQSVSSRSSLLPTSSLQIFSQSSASRTSSQFQPSSSGSSSTASDLTSSFAMVSSVLSFDISRSLASSSPPSTQTSSRPVVSQSSIYEASSKSQHVTEVSSVTLTISGSMTAVLTTQTTDVHMMNPSIPVSAASISSQGSSFSISSQISSFQSSISVSTKMASLQSISSRPPNTSSIRSRTSNTTISLPSRTIFTVSFLVETATSSSTRSGIVGATSQIISSASISQAIQTDSIEPGPFISTTIFSSGGSWTTSPVFEAATTSNTLSGTSASMSPAVNSIMSRTSSEMFSSGSTSQHSASKGSVQSEPSGLSVSMKSQFSSSIVSTSSSTIRNTGSLSSGTQDSSSHISTKTNHQVSSSVTSSRVGSPTIPNAATSRSNSSTTLTAITSSRVITSTNSFSSITPTWTSIPGSLMSSGNGTFPTGVPGHNCPDGYEPGHPGGQCQPKKPEGPINSIPSKPHRPSKPNRGNNTGSSKPPSVFAPRIRSLFQFYDGSVFDPKANSQTSGDDRKKANAINDALPLDIQNAFNDNAVNFYDPGTTDFYYAKICYQIKNDCKIIQAARSCNCYQDVKDGQVHFLTYDENCALKNSSFAPNTRLPVAAAYTVSRRQTLRQIASLNKVNLGTLLAANPQISDPESVVTGEEINIPAQAYTVSRAGKTLGSIAEQLGIDPQALKDLNYEIKRNQKLVTGQVIKVPGEKIDQPFALTVPAGTTVQMIAEKYGVTVEAIRMANPNLTDETRLKTDQVIKLPIYLPQQGTVDWTDKCPTNDAKNAPKTKALSAKLRRWEVEAKKGETVLTTTTIEIGPTSSPIINIVVAMNESPDPGAEKFAAGRDEKDAEEAGEKALKEKKKAFEEIKEKKKSFEEEVKEEVKQLNEDSAKDALEKKKERKEKAFKQAQEKASQAKLDDESREDRKGILKYWFEKVKGTGKKEGEEEQKAHKALSAGH